MHMNGSRFFATAVAVSLLVIASQIGRSRRDFRPTGGAAASNTGSGHVGPQPLETLAEPGSALVKETTNLKNALLLSATLGLTRRLQPNSQKAQTARERHGERGGGYRDNRSASDDSVEPRHFVAKACTALPYQVVVASTQIEVDGRSKNAVEIVLCQIEG